MAALRIQDDEAVEEGVQKFFDLLTQLEGADLNYSELQKKTKFLAFLLDSWSSLIINLNRDLPCLLLEDVKRAILQEDFRRRELASADGTGAASIGRGYGRGRGRGRAGGRFDSNNFNGGRRSGGYGSDNKSYGRSRGRFDSECHYCNKSGHMWRDCFKLPNGWSPAQGQEGRGAGGGRGRGRGGRGGRRGGAANMKNGDNESESRDDPFPGHLFFVSTRAPAGLEKDEGFEEPAAVGKVTLHSLDYWVIDSGATYSMTPRTDLLTELEPSPVKHVTSALGQRAEVKGMGKAMFKGTNGKMVGLKNMLWVPNLGAAGAEYFLTMHCLTAVSPVHCTAQLLPALLCAALPTCCSVMASLYVFTFDHEGCPIQFDTWLDYLQLATRSQWLTRDAAARFAIHNHLRLAECAHFRQHKTAKALYDAVVTRYSSPATAALGGLILPYLFPELSAFATIEDLVTHLRTSNARYRAALPAKFLAMNPPPVYITLYFIVTRLPDSLRVVRDHFLTLDPTDLTVDLLEQHLLAAGTSVVVVGAARGTPRTPFFEGCSPSPLAPSYTSATVVDVLGAEDVRAASALSVKCRSSKGKGGRGGGGGSGSGGGAAVEVVAPVEMVAGVGALVAAVVAAVGVAVVAAVGVVAIGRGASRGSGSCPYVIRTGDRAGQTSGMLHTQHRRFSCLDDAWRTDFGDEAERPRWAELL
ncbi:unnamed protein product, partial [Closterium sp. NIES-53]